MDARGGAYVIASVRTDMYVRLCIPVKTGTGRLVLAFIRVCNILFTYLSALCMCVCVCALCLCVLHDSTRVSSDIRLLVLCTHAPRIAYR